MPAMRKQLWNWKEYLDGGEVIVTGNMRFYLDILMFVFLGTFFNRNAISMDYHVWGGLVFFLVTVGHVWLNRRWLTGLWKRKKRLQDWADVLLMMAWLGMAVTGILGAKAIGIELQAVKPYHKFLGALSLLLVAVHIGFHWVYLREHIRKRCTWMAKIPRLAGTLCLVATLCFGTYSYVDSGFGRFLAAPFTSSQRGMEHREGGVGREHHMPEFSLVNLSSLMAEVSAMVYLGAYVVRKGTAFKPPRGE